jgi:excisionase family DNA binding protein
MTLLDHAPYLNKLTGMPIKFEFYTIDEIAEETGLSRQRIHQLIKDLEIPTTKEGRRLLIREDHAALLFEKRKNGRPAKKMGRPRKPKNQN